MREISDKEVDELLDATQKIMQEQLFEIGAENLRVGIIIFEKDHPNGDPKKPVRYTSSISDENCHKECAIEHWLAHLTQKRHSH